MSDYHLQVNNVSCDLLGPPGVMARYHTAFRLARHCRIILKSRYCHRLSHQAIGLIRFYEATVPSYVFGHRYAPSMEPSNWSSGDMV
jgi:hypothetical protein